ncbi:MAG: hypothetical protein AB7G68_02735 [Nitrospiraceae bacterium]
MTQLRPSKLDNRGVTYLMVMFSIVLIGITLSAVGKHWKMIVQREKEADLLAKGIEIQNALAFYSAAMKAGRMVPMEVYPPSLAELTRLPKPHLRRAYKDPMSDGDWEYIRAPTGGIMGVRSRSTEKPIKEREFPLAVRHFEGRKTYRDWTFQHPNPSSLSMLVSPMGMGMSPGSPFIQPGSSPMPFPVQAQPMSQPFPSGDPPLQSPPANP